MPRRISIRRRSANSYANTPPHSGYLKQLELITAAEEDPGQKGKLAALNYLALLTQKRKQDAGLMRAYLLRTHADTPLMDHISSEALSRTCKVCNGEEKKLQCLRCRGDGKCTACKGRGGRTFSGLNDQTKTTKCPKCEANGKCPICEGSGEKTVPCGTCKGRGKVLNDATIRAAYMRYLNAIDLSTEPAPVDEPGPDNTVAEESAPEEIPETDTGETPEPEKIINDPFADAEDL